MRAWDAGCQEAFGASDGDVPHVEDWMKALDGALDVLDLLAPDEKQKLVLALIVTVNSDGEWVPAEVDLLRAVCADLHVPLPIGV